jgi:hypothetical protein
MDREHKIVEVQGLSCKYQGPIVITFHWKRTAGLFCRTTRALLKNSRSEGVRLTLGRPIKYRRPGLDLGSQNRYATPALGSRSCGPDFNNPRQPRIARSHSNCPDQYIEAVCVVSNLSRSPLIQRHTHYSKRYVPTSAGS